MSLASGVLLAFILGLFLVAVFGNLAHHHARLLDRPCTRKKHDGAVPLVGGVAVYVAFAISLLLYDQSVQSLVLVSTAGVLVFMGVIDDDISLGVKRRLLVQIACAVMMFYVGGEQLTRLHNLTGEGVLVFGTVSALVFTVFCTIGVINAINMIDGADGLAGSLVAVTLAALIYLANASHNEHALAALTVLFGALTGFLLFNLRLGFARARVFMGDAGSTFLGFFLVWFFIELSQNSGGILSEVSAGWILGIPLVDTCALVTRRMLHGKSPFAAGRDHIHHLFIDRGWSVNRTLAVLVLIQSVFVSTGLLINGNPLLESIFFWFFVGIVVLYIVLSEWFAVDSAKGRRLNLLRLVVENRDGRLKRILSRR